MPKLSLYIPDDLWNRARAVDPALNQSQVAQRALRHWIDAQEARPPAAFEPPPDAAPPSEGLVRRFANEARDQYQAAYRAAMELAERLSWRSLDDLASRGWDWAAWLRHGGRDVAGTLPAWLSDREPVAKRRNTTSIQGLVDGLRDIWESVQVGAPREPGRRAHEPRS